MKIATLNLCLSLKYKKFIIDQILRSNEVKILCMQEVEIESEFNTDILTISGFQLELETNSKIPLEWLNLSIGMYKVKCKKLLF